MCGKAKENEKGKGECVRKIVEYPVEKSGACYDSFPHFSTGRKTHKPVGEKLGKKSAAVSLGWW